MPFVSAGSAYYTTASTLTVTVTPWVNSTASTTAWNTINLVTNANTALRASDIAHFRQLYEECQLMRATNEAWQAERPPGVPRHRFTERAVQASEARDWQEAHERSMRLLRSALSERQREELARGYFEVCAPSGRRYRVYSDSASGNVQEHDDRGHLSTYCAHPVGVPLGDQLLAQKLMLETDEEEFLRVANCHYRRAA